MATVYASEVLIISGFYTGKDLYVQNPMLPDNKSFSTQEVFVNETLVLSKPITSAYIINLSHLTPDETVEIRIVHKEDFPPKIINAYVIRNREIQQNVVTSEPSYAPVKDVFRWCKADRKTVRWLTSGEKGGGTFQLQRADQESWITIEEVPARANNEKSVYRLLVAHQPGENNYRLRLVDRDGYVSYSPTITYRLNQR